MTEGFEGDELAAMGDGDRGAGEGVLRNCLVQDREGGGEDLILIFAGTDQKRSWSCAVQSGSVLV